MFDYVHNHGLSGEDKRTVLLRVVIPPDETTRNNIIKATNFQTSIPPISLRAMDQLHFDIEHRLKLYGLYYDRRKGEYREQRKPIAKIVSMLELGKSVIAILLQRPNDARARPGTILNKEESYSLVFNDNFNRELYATCIRIDRRVRDYLKNKSDLERDVQADLRYYIEMMASCQIAKKKNLEVDDISGLGEKLPSVLSDEVISQAVEQVHSLYVDLGGTDKVAKGSVLIEEMKQQMGSV